MRITRNTIFYALYIVGVTVVFLYVLFPSEALKTYLAYRLSQENSDVKVNIDRVSPVLPPGIKLHAVSAYQGNTALVELENLKLMPGLMSLFGSQTSVDFKGGMYAGKLSGTAEFDHNPQGPEITVDGVVSGVDVQKILELQRLSAHKISGKLGGNFVYLNRGPERSLTGEFAVADLRVNLAAPVFGQQSLEFKDVDAELALQRSTLVVKRCSFKGNQLDAEISGTVTLDERGAGRALDLTADVKPHHALLVKIEKSIPPGFLQQIKSGKASISFKIGGTWNDPSFSLN